MTDSKPIDTATELLYFAYANSQENPLPTLTKEDNNVNQHLTPRALEKNHFNIQKDSNATIEGIKQILTDYKDQIYLFHYSGHAGNDKLLVQDKTINLDGIVELLLECPNLKIVVLNGCSTKGQVDTLLNNDGGEQKGVPVVIATKREIEDGLATEFADVFYKTLSRNYSTVEEAFKTAISVLKIGPRILNNITENTRGIIFSNDIGQEEVFGIYYKNENEDHKNYKLPSAIPKPSSTDFEPNKILFKTIFINLKKYKTDIENLLEDEDEFGEKLGNINGKNKMVIRSFPHNIAEQLRKLIAIENDKTLCLPIGKKRLNQLKKTYEITIQLLVYILIGQLWDLKNKHPKKYQFSSKEQKYFLSLFSNFSSNSVSARYEHLINYLMDLLIKEKNFFIKESDNIEKGIFFYKNEEFIDACRNIESLQVDEDESLNEYAIFEQVANHCQEIETHLAKIFKHLLFLSNYRLVSVKNIVIKNQRHIPKTQYMHTFTELEYDSLGSTNKKKPLDHIMGESSITLCKNLEKVTNSNTRAYLESGDVNDGLTYLNLSPFLFDKNSFSTSEQAMPEIFQFSEYQSGTKELYFNQIQKQRPFFTLDINAIEKEQKEYKNILKQFNSFCNLIFDKNLQEIL